MSLNGFNIPLIFDGEDIHTNARTTVESHEPPHNAIGSYSHLENIRVEIPKICERALEGWEQWSSKPFYERINILKNAIEIIKSRKDEFIESHLEIGGPAWFAEFNYKEFISQLEDYIGHMADPQGEILQSKRAEMVMVVREPIGPVLAMSPWNAPVLLCARSLLPVLAAGCSAIVRSPERAPRSAYLVVRCLIDAGLPPNTVQLVNNRPEDSKEAVELFLSNPAVRKIGFTGSEMVGRSIAQVAGKYLKPTCLELSGKNYAIVDQVKDLRKSAESVLGSAWAHYGQICMSTDRVYIHESIYNEYLKVLSEVATGTTQTSHPRFPQLAENVKALINDAVSKGARLVHGVSDADALVPVILENVSEDMTLSDVESFGPVLSVHKYSDLSQLIQSLNRGVSALSSSIWMDDVYGAMKWARKLEVSKVHINSSSIFDEATVPHGGSKDSGMGRYNGKWGINEFSYLKTISLN